MFAVKFCYCLSIQVKDKDEASCCRVQVLPRSAIFKTKPNFMHWEVIRLAIQYTNLIQKVPTDSSRPSFFSCVYKKTIAIMVLTVLYCVHCTPCMIVDQQIQKYKYNFSASQMQIQMYKYCMFYTPCMIVDQPTLNLQMSILLSLAL